MQNTMEHGRTQLMLRGKDYKLRKFGYAFLFVKWKGEKEVGTGVRG